MRADYVVMRADTLRRWCSLLLASEQGGKEKVREEIQNELEGKTNGTKN